MLCDIVPYTGVLDLTATTEAQIPQHSIYAYTFSETKPAYNIYG